MRGFIQKGEIVRKIPEDKIVETILEEIERGQDL